MSSLEVKYIVYVNTILSTEDKTAKILPYHKDRFKS